jgi:hypothetical protein
MLFLSIGISYSLKYVYLRVYLLMFVLVALHSIFAVRIFCVSFTQLGQVPTQFIHVTAICRFFKPFDYLCSCQPNTVEKSANHSNIHILT